MPWHAAAMLPRLSVSCHGWHDGEKRHANARRSQPRARAVRRRRAARQAGSRCACAQSEVRARAAAKQQLPPRDPFSPPPGQQRYASTPAACHAARAPPHCRRRWLRRSKAMPCSIACRRPDLILPAQQIHIQRLNQKSAQRDHHPSQRQRQMADEDHES